MQGPGAGWASNAFGGAGAGSMNNYSASQQPPLQPARQNFSKDDFPALGSTSASLQQQQQQPGDGRPDDTYAQVSFGRAMQGQPQAQAPDVSAYDDFPALPGMLISEVRPGSTTAAGKPGDSHKLQQHRSSLLGAMRMPSSGPPAGQSTNARSSSGRPINAPPNLSLMSGPPALEQLSHATATNDDAKSGVPLPSHAPGLRTSTVSIGPEHLKRQEPIVLTEQERYGLKGLLPIIVNSTSDASLLALGSDLTTLGLKLPADDTRLLSSLWSSPWSDTPTLDAMHLDWRLPSCYTSEQMPQILPPAGLKVGNFAEETLFYIFYTQPRDRMQELAAQELTSRNWRYHKSLGLWLTKEPGIEPAVRTPVMERGQYVFFDYERWEKVKKPFELYYEDLEDRFGAGAGAGAQQSQPAQGASLGVPNLGGGPAASPAGGHPSAYPAMTSD